MSCSPCSHVLFLCNAYIRQVYGDIVSLSLFFNENITLVSEVGSLAHARYSSCSGKNGRAVGKAIRVGPTAADCLPAAKHRRTRQSCRDKRTVGETNGKYRGAVPSPRSGPVTFMNTISCIWSNLESVKTTVNARFESVETMVEKTSERFERRLEEQQGSLKSELKEELLN